MLSVLYTVLVFSGSHLLRFGQGPNKVTKKMFFICYQHVSISNHSLFTQQSKPNFLNSVSVNMMPEQGLVNIFFRKLQVRPIIQGQIMVLFLIPYYVAIHKR